MKGMIGTMQRLHADQAGQATLEWVLLLAGFVLPMVGVVFPILVKILSEHYRMVVFLETLPFP